LIRQNKVVAAEAQLATALAAFAKAAEACEADGREEDARAARGASDRLRASPAFAAVTTRVAQYESIGEVLRCNDWKMAWSCEGAKLWVSCRPGSKEFEFRLVCNINAPIAHCMAYNYEFDLLPQHEPFLIGAPRALKEEYPLRLVQQTLISCLLFRLELICEVMRFPNTEFGFLAEGIRSSFPLDGVELPAKRMRNLRLGVNTRLIWMPVGGGEDGTILVQATRGEAPMPITERLLSFAVSKVGASLVKNLRNSAKMVGKSGSPYQERLQRDAAGLYGVCAQVEAAAARRPAICTTSLPGPEIFDRPATLPPVLAVP